MNRKKASLCNTEILLDSQRDFMHNCISSTRWGTRDQALQNVSLSLTQGVLISFLESRMTLSGETEQASTWAVKKGRIVPSLLRKWERRVQTQGFHLLGAITCSCTSWASPPHPPPPISSVLNENCSFSILCRTLRLALLSLLYQASQGAGVGKAKLELIDLISLKQHLHAHISERDRVPDRRQNSDTNEVLYLLSSNSPSLQLRYWLFAVKVLQFYKTISNMNLKYC